MRLALFFLFFSLIGITPLHTQTKVDPLLRIMANNPPPAGSLFSKVVSKSKHGEDLVECFIKTEYARTVIEKLESIGAKVGVVLGNVMTARIPLDRLDQIADWEEVEYIEGPKPMRVKMNTARVYTNVDDVQAGTGLSQAYDGTGVVVGVVDTSIDWDHVDYNNGSSTSRISYIWDQTKSGSGVTEISGSTGVECTNATIIAATCTATANGDTDDGDEHGSHVTGIAAGNDATYKGVAPGANIVFVFNGSTTVPYTNDTQTSTTFGTHVVEAVTYIFKKAATEGKAAVVNLSLGTSLGAHDDTSALEAALNTLTSGKKGRAIVNAAGNENCSPEDSNCVSDFGGIHAAIDVTSGTDEAVEFALLTYTTPAIVDIWLNSASTCTVEIDVFKDGTVAKETRTVNMSAISAGFSTTNTDDSNVTLALDFGDSSNAQNSKKHATATLTVNSAIVASSYSFDVIFRGTCTGDAWLYPDATSYIDFYKRNDGIASSNGYTYFAGDSNKTITIPGTASSVIAAGSYMEESTWTDKNGTSHDQAGSPGSLGILGGTEEGISNFSSLGPTADGRTKPDIAAPGEPIISTLASNFIGSFNNGVVADSPEAHFKLQGTSMASPHVAGIVALLFQKNKCLTTAQIKTALTENKITDAFTGTVPNNTWGYGKADALAAINAVSVADSDCSSEITSEGSTLAAPQNKFTTTTGTDAGGGSSSTASTSSNCSFSPKKTEKNEREWILILTSIALLWVLRSQRKIL